ncbi:MAG: choice-of-anchor D domain-containing protein [Bacteroidia bacterium]
MADIHHYYVDLLLNCYPMLILKRVLHSASILFLISAFTSTAFAGDYFWVGGSGMWSDHNNHWATTSGGSVFHNQVPSQLDNIYFDEHSFTAANQVITMDVLGTCKDMIWEGISHNPTFTANLLGLEVHGKFEAHQDMTLNLLGSGTFLEISGDVLIDSATVAITVADGVFDLGALRVIQSDLTLSHNGGLMKSTGDWIIENSTVDFDRNTSYQNLEITGSFTADSSTINILNYGAMTIGGAFTSLRNDFDLDQRYGTISIGGAFTSDSSNIVFGNWGTSIAGDFTFDHDTLDWNQSSGSLSVTGELTSDWSDLDFTTYGVSITNDLIFKHNKLTWNQNSGSFSIGGDFIADSADLNMTSRSMTVGGDFALNRNDLVFQHYSGNFTVNGDFLSDSSHITMNTYTTDIKGDFFLDHDTLTWNQTSGNFYVRNQFASDSSVLNLNLRYLNVTKSFKLNNDSLRFQHYANNFTVGDTLHAVNSFMHMRTYGVSISDDLILENDSVYWDQTSGSFLIYGDLISDSTGLNFNQCRSMDVRGDMDIKKRYFKLNHSTGTFYCRGDFDMEELKTDIRLEYSYYAYMYGHWKMDSVTGTVYNRDRLNITDSLVISRSDLDFTSNYTTTIIGKALIFDRSPVNWTHTPQIQVGGSVLLDSNMVWNQTGQLYLNASTTGNIIASAGHPFNHDVYFAGGSNSSEWTIQDDFKVGMTRTTTVTRGSVLFGDSNPILGNYFNADYSSLINLDFTGSDSIKMGYYFRLYPSTNTTFTPGTARLIMDIADSNSPRFEGGGKTFNDIEVRMKYTGSSRVFNLYDNNTTIDSLIVYAAREHYIDINSTFQIEDLLFQTAATTNLVSPNHRFDGTSTFGTISFTSENNNLRPILDININNTVDSIKLPAASTIDIQSGRILTVNNDIDIPAESCLRPSIKGGGSIVSNGDSIVVDFAIIENNTASGTATFKAPLGTDQGNVTGWQITTGDSRMYWVGDGGNFTDPTHWSYTSGGPAAGCVPERYNDIIFDANSFSQTGQTVTYNVAANSTYNSMVWDNVDHFPTFNGTTSGRDLSLTEDFTINSPMKVVSLDYTYVGGDFALSDSVDFDTRTYFKVVGDFSLTDKVNFYAASYVDIDGEFSMDKKAVFRNGSYVRIDKDFTLADTTNFNSSNYVIIGGEFAQSHAAIYRSSSYTNVSGDFTQSNTTDFFASSSVSVSGNFTQSDTAIYRSNSSLSVTGGFIQSDKTNVYVGSTVTVNQSFTLSDTATFRSTNYVRITGDFTQSQAATYNASSYTDVSGHFTQSNSTDFYTGSYLTVDRDFTLSDTAKFRSNNRIFVSGNFTQSDTTQFQSSDYVNITGNFLLQDEADFIGGNYMTVRGDFHALDTASFSNSRELNVYKSFILNDSLRKFELTSNKRVSFLATTSGHVIDLGERTLDAEAIFNGSNGEWTLADDFRIVPNRSTTFHRGRFISDGHALDFGNNFYGRNIYSTSNLNFTGTDSVIVHGSWQLSTSSSASLTMGTAIMYLTDASSYSIYGGNKAYNKLKVVATPGSNSTVNIYDNNSYSDSVILCVNNTANLHLHGGNWEEVIVNHDDQSTGGTNKLSTYFAETYNHSIADVKIHTNSMTPSLARFRRTSTTDILSLPDGTELNLLDANLNINDSLLLQGDCVSYGKILGNNQATCSINMGSTPAGKVKVDFVELENHTISGTNGPFTATNAVDRGNTSGWSFASAAAQDYYWIGGTGNWSDPTHWATSSGGTADACVPTANDNVFFDASSFSAANQTVTVDFEATANNMTWDGSIDNAIMQVNNELDLRGSVVMDDVTSVRGNAAMSIAGSFTVTANVSWSKSNTLTVGTDFDVTGVSSWSSISTLTVGGNLNVDGASSWSSMSTINVAGDFDLVGVSTWSSISNLNVTGNFDVIGNSTWSSVSNLRVTGDADFNGASSWSNASLFNVTGKLDIQGLSNWSSISTFTVGDSMIVNDNNTWNSVRNISVGKTFIVNDSSTWKNINGNITVSDNFIVPGPSRWENFYNVTVDDTMRVTDNSYWMARQYSGYTFRVRKDLEVSGESDWSWMNLDIDGKMTVDGASEWREMYNITVDDTFRVTGNSIWDQYSSSTIRTSKAFLVDGPSSWVYFSYDIGGDMEVKGKSTWDFRNGGHFRGDFTIADSAIINNSGTTNYYQSFEIDSTTTWNYAGTMYFKASAGGMTVDPADHDLPSTIQFDGTNNNGEWTLLNNLKGVLDLYVQRGKLISGGKRITARSLFIPLKTERYLYRTYRCYRYGYDYSCRCYRYRWTTCYDYRDRTLDHGQALDLTGTDSVFVERNWEVRQDRQYVDVDMGAATLKFESNISTQFTFYSTGNTSYNDIIAKNHYNSTGTGLYMYTSTGDEVQYLDVYMKGSRTLDIHNNGIGFGDVQVRYGSTSSNPTISLTGTAPFGDVVVDVATPIAVRPRMNLNSSPMSFGYFSVPMGSHIYMGSYNGSYSMDSLYTASSCQVPATIEGRSGYNPTLTIGGGSLVLDNPILRYHTLVDPLGGYVANSPDITSATGWSLNARTPQTFYWIKGTGNWNDTTHWSFTSGGPSTGCYIPSEIDDVIFDNNSFTGSNQYVNVYQQVEVNNMTWENLNPAHSNIRYNSDSYALTVNGDLKLEDADFEWYQRYQTFLVKGDFIIDNADGTMHRQRNNFTVEGDMKISDADYDITYSSSYTQTFRVKGDMVWQNASGSFNSSHSQIYVEGDMRFENSTTAWTSSQQNNISGDLRFINANANWYTSQNVNIGGSLQLTNGMPRFYASNIYFNGTLPGNTIDLDGRVMDRPIYINGSGSWKMTDDLNSSTNLQLILGTFATGGYDLRARAISSSGSGVKEFDFTGTDSVIVTHDFLLAGTNQTNTIDNAAIYFKTSGANDFRINAGGGTLDKISFEHNSPSTQTIRFESHTNGNTYGDISLDMGDRKDIDIYGSNTFGTMSIVYDYDIISSPPQINIHNSNFFEGLQIEGLGRQGPYVTVHENNTFNSLVATGRGTRMIFGANRTQTIVDNFLVTGVGGFPVIMESTVSGQQATLFKADGDICLDFARLEDMLGTGGATFNAGASSIDISNNTNWQFTSCVGYYWVGGTGNWNDLSHWATSSGGSLKHLVLPGSNDNVAFDANSFSAAGDTVYLNVSNAKVRTMSWLSSLYTPTFFNDQGNDIEIHGGLFLIPNMNYSLTGALRFKAGSGATFKVNSGGQVLGDVYFEGLAPNTASGTWKISKDLESDSTIYLEQGTLRTEGFKITVPKFITRTSQTKSLILDNSEIVIQDSIWDMQDASGLTFDPGTSTIILQNDSGTVTFNGGDETYYDLELKTGSISDQEINDENTFNTITINNGITAVLEHSKTQTIASLVADGNCLNEQSIKSSQAGTQATLSKSSGSNTIRFTNIKDIAATGGATFTADQSDDQGNNTGWTINAFANAALTTTVVEAGPPSYNDGSVTIAANGNGPFTYLWSNNERTPGISNLTSGTYKAYITDADLCKDSVTALVDRCIDTDGDNICNSVDPDDDNDGCADENDPFPLVKSAVIEIRGNATLIADGDNSPSTSDSTNYGSTGISLTRTVTYQIKNNGPTPLMLTGTSPVSITGSSEFTVSQPGALTLAPGATTSFNVTFTPTASTTSSATITVANNDCQREMFMFAIRAQGVTCGTMAFTSTVVDEVCPGTGSITFNSPSGGVAPYMYSIDGGSTYQTAPAFTSLLGGPHQLRVRDAALCPSAITTETVGLSGLNIVPTVTCPSNQTLNVSSGQCYGRYNIFSPVSISCGTATWGYDLTGTTTASVTGIGYTATSGVINFNAGVTTVSLSATNGVNNATPCSFTVTVNDNISPTLTCPGIQNITPAMGDCEGQYSIPDPISDNCSANATWSYGLTGATTGSVASINDGSASAMINFSPGTTTVTLNGTDGTNSATACSFSVIVTDNQAPTLACPADQQLTTSTSPASVCTVDYTIPDPITDNCSSATWEYNLVGQTAGSATGIADGSNSGAISFNQGITTVFLKGTDGFSSAPDCNFTVTVTDATPPVAACKNLSVELDASNQASITGSQIDDNSSDACGGTVMLGVSPSTVDCDDLGAKTVTLTVTDAAGNTAQCTATVTVNDNINPCNSAPVAVCKDIVVSANTTCQGIASAADFNGGSTDADNDVMTFVVNPVGPYTLGVTNVILTVSDPLNASTICTAKVTVNDTDNPTITCPADQILQLGSNCDVVLGAYSPASAMDNCSTPTISQVPVSTMVISANTVVTLTAMDPAGNSADCSFNVTVQDNIAPTAVCQDKTINLDANGNGSITATDIDNGSNDNCGIASRVLDITAFTCTDIPTKTVTLTITDLSNNTATCTSTVTIIDPIAPVATCKDIAVNLDASGNATIKAADINDGSSDACGLYSMGLDIFAFTCTDMPSKTVTLTVTDKNTNSATCTSVITINDPIAPVATCKDIAINLDASGNATIKAADINDGSSDACGLYSMGLDIFAFSCTDMPSKTVTLTVTDKNTNSATCTSVVTINDPIAPNAICQDASVALDASGNGSITVADIDNGSNDNCGIKSRVLDITAFT